MRDSALLSARVLAWLLIMPCCAAAAAGGDAAAGGRVTSLSAETFAQFVNGSAVSLVEFYAPWCGICKALTPELESAAAALSKKHKAAVQVGKVDATVETGLAETYGVEEYPLLLIFHGGMPYPFEAETRSKADILATMKLHTDPSWRPPTDHVLAIASAPAFDKSPVAKAKLALLEFHAPWCGHCKQLGPFYADAARLLAEQGSPILLAKVDGTAEAWSEETGELLQARVLTQRFNVTAFPALFVLRYGVPAPYTGPRNSGEAIAGFMADLLLPASVLISELKLLERMIDFPDGGTGLPGFPPPASQAMAPLNGMVSLVGCFAAEDPHAQWLAGGAEHAADNELYAAYLAAAEAVRGTHHSMHVGRPELCKKVGLKPGQAAVVSSKHLGSGAPLGAVRDRAGPIELSSHAGTSMDDVQRAFHNFIRDNSAPLVGVATPWNLETTYATRRPLVLAFASLDFTSEFGRASAQKVRSAVVEAASTVLQLGPSAVHNLTASFAIADIEQHREGLILDFGLEEIEETGVVGFGPAGEKYRLDPDKAVTPDSLAGFAAEIGTDDLEQFLRSQPKPKKSKNKGAVKVVVGSTFADMVLDRSKNVLVEFFAPWCGHCKSFAASYEKVGLAVKALKHKPLQLSVTKIDGTANDYPVDYFPVGAYPSMFLAKAGGESPVKYDRRRFEAVFEAPADALKAFLCAEMYALRAHPDNQGFGCAGLEMDEEERGDTDGTRDDL